MKKIIIATIKPWNIKNALILKKKLRNKFNVSIISNKSDLTYNKIKRINPNYIFFPHWSWIIPEKIYKEYKCVVFHMTDLPFGRGGSPLQNLIVQEKTKTKISALKVIKQVDSGPVYLKEPLNLNGSAQEIYIRASYIIYTKMIPSILKGDIKPKKQAGKVVKFNRRKPSQGNIAKLDNLKTVYDYIRMLDAEGYPKAFIETKSLRLEFSDAKQEKQFLTSKVKIEVKK